MTSRSSPGTHPPRACPGKYPWQNTLHSTHSSLSVLRTVRETAESRLFRGQHSNTRSLNLRWTSKCESNHYSSNVTKHFRCLIEIFKSQHPGDIASFERVTQENSVLHPDVKEKFLHDFHMLSCCEVVHVKAMKVPLVYVFGGIL